MTKFRIRIAGCHDSTYVDGERFTNDELEAILKLARICEEESTYTCMPVVCVDQQVIETSEREIWEEIALDGS